MSAKRAREDDDAAPAPVAPSSSVDVQSALEWKIERLVLNNFKSFGDTVEIGPFKDFNSIIGPNGAGKSNLMDAISFVLGMRATHLRGNQLSHLIFNPSGKDVADSDAASVELVLRNAKSGAVIKFLRSVSGKSGSSDYRIDGKSVTKEAYDAKLATLNVLIKARNFLVFQGDVEAIASKTPRDFTELLEQISGSAELIDEYNERLVAKQAAEENTIFTFQKKKGINAEKKHVKAQKDEAEKFQQLEQTKNEIKVQYYLWQLFHIGSYETRVVERREAAARDVDSAAQAIDSAERAATSARKRLADAQKAALLAERRVRDAAADADKQRAAAAVLHAEQAQAERHRVATQRSIDKLVGEREQQSKDVAVMTRDLAAVERAQAELASRAVALPELHFSAAQLAEYHACQERAGRATHEQRSKLAALKRESQLGQELLAAREASVAELTATLEQKRDAIAQLGARRDKVEAFVAEQRVKHREAVSELAAARKAARDAELRQATLNEEFERCEKELREARSDQRDVDRRAQDARILDDLQRDFVGVQGRVCDLCQPAQARFAAAVSVALGHHMDSIIVNDTATAMNCIRYLKEQRRPARTFLPLDSLQTKVLDESLRQLGDDVWLALDVMTFAPSLQRAMHFVVGNALVCTTTLRARDMVFESRRAEKVITLDGTCFRKSGLITGGRASLDAKAGRWSEKRLAETKKRRDAAVKELADLIVVRRAASDEESLAAQVASLETRLKYAGDDLNATKERLTTAESEAAQVAAELKTAKAAVSELSKASVARDKSISALEKEISGEEEKLFAAFSKQVNVDNIREYEARRLREAQARADEAAALDAQRARLRQQLEFEQTRAVAPALTRLEQRLADDDAALVKLRKSIGAADALVAKAERALDDATTAQTTATAALAAANEATRADRDAAAAAVDRRAELLKALTVADAELGRLRQLRAELLAQCKVDEIELPKRSGAPPPPSQSSEQPSQVDEAEEAAAAAATAQDIDLRLVPKSRRVANGFGSADYQAGAQRYQEEIAAVQAELDKMAPNLKAIERFDKVIERLNDTDQVLEQARNAAKEATDKFNAVRDERAARFNAAYGAISAHIDPIYKELTRGKNLAAVGTAYLSLENTDEPFSAGVKYHAMPPNKVFRDMEQLSGGEKTVAALALLFAIHSYRPSPFFVLDEVDAALDSVNVSKVANFIRARSKQTQFVMISLKEDAYKKSDALIGVYRELKLNASRVATLDLTPYAF